MYQDFRNWATQFGVAAGILKVRTQADNQLYHYEQKVLKLKQADKSNQKAQERYARNVEKLSQAKMSFEMTNTECYSKMLELAQDKQRHINPIVTKFFRLNNQFFKKTVLAFNDIKSIDVNSMRDSEKMAKQQQAMGGKDMALNKMKIWDEQDKTMRASQANFDNEFDKYNNYKFDSNVYFKDAKTDYN